MEKGDQNITVLLRIRPRNSREVKENASVIATASSEAKQVSVKYTHELTKTFTFDKVFGPNSTQEHVFNGIKNMVNEVFLGYNCTIFAYGQVTIFPSDNT